MQSDKDIPGISCGLVNNSVFEWEVMLMLDDESGIYGGGYHVFHFKRCDDTGSKVGTSRQWMAGYGKRW